MDLADNHIKPSLGSIPLQKLTADVIQKFYNEKSEKGRLDGKGGLSPRIIHMMHNVINRALKQAVKQRFILNNPAEATTMPSSKQKEMNFLTPEEIKKYLAAARDEKLYPAFLLEITSGLRRGELLALTWACVDLVLMRLLP